jgi:hypothetical protein
MLVGTIGVVMILISLFMLFKPKRQVPGIGISVVKL